MTDHRQLAVDLYNHAWSLLRKETRTREEEDEMVDAAHASSYHWRRVGTAKNRVRSEWQISRAYAVAGRAEPALHHARRCVELAEAAEDLDDFDLPYAYEALARAHAVAGDDDEARSWAAQARAAGAQIEDADDRQMFEADVEDLPR